MGTAARPRHAHAPGRRRIPHEPGLDGLRGVAVVLVLLFHGGVGVVGGALGVDVFLVLSGFLITALLLAERDSTGGVDLRAFWGRRVRRLVPAALAVIAAVAVHAAVTDGDDTSLRLDALSSLGWWSNWRFAAAEAGYFESFGAPSPLRHTWSLAVEEQWYLLWPLLLLGLRRVTRGHGPLFAAVVALMLASAGAMWALAADVDRAHFGTDTRAQGLLAGAALAVVLARRPASTWSAPVRTAVSLLGAAGGAVVLGMAWRVPGTDTGLYRGGHLLVALATAAVIAAAVVPGGPVKAALSPRPLRALGRVSYGLYLWHWPVFVWLTPDDLGGLDRWPTFAVRVAVTTVLTVASWRLLERPVLDRTLALPRPRIALGVGYAAVVVVVVAGTLGSSGTGGSGGVATAAPTLPAGFEVVSAAGRPAATAPPPAPGVLDTPPTPSGRTGDPVVTIVGDSMGWSLGWNVEPVDGVEVVDGAVVGCGLDPAAVIINGQPDVRESHPVPCDKVMDLWLWWSTSSTPDVLVLVLGAWEVYDRELPDGTRLDVGTPEWREWLAPRLEEAAAQLAAAAPHALVAVTDVPCFDERDPSLGGPASPRNDPARVAAVNELLDDLVARHPARLVPLRWSGLLCGEGAFDRGDGVHLTEPAAHDIWAGPLGEEARRLAAIARGVAPAAPAAPAP